jgi:hypothetical protein
MTKEAIEQFCDSRRVDIDKWTVKNSVDTSQAPSSTNRCDGERSFVSIAYWYWIGKTKYRVFEVAPEMEAAIIKCIDAEGDIKAGKPKQLKPPSPLMKTVSCYNCGYTHQVRDGDTAPGHCFSCGNSI